MISGTPITGKSTLATLLKRHITGDHSGKEVEEPDKDDLVKILSTESLLQAMRKFIPFEEDPILHHPSYGCGKDLNPDNYIMKPSETIQGWLQ